MTIWLWIIIYCCVIVGSFIGHIIIIIDSVYGFALLPNELKQRFQLTWFGAITLFIFGLIFNPLTYLYLVLGLAFKGHWPKH